VVAILAVARPELFREWKVAGVEAKACSAEAVEGVEGVEGAEGVHGGDDARNEGGAMLDRQGEPCDGSMRVVSVVDQTEWDSTQRRSVVDGVDGGDGGDGVAGGANVDDERGARWSGMVRIPLALVEEGMLDAMHILLCTTRAESVDALASPNATVEWGFVPWMASLLLMALAAGVGFSHQVIAFLNRSERLSLGGGDIVRQRRDVDARTGATGGMSGRPLQQTKEKDS
jgi:hypothetical protein